MGRVYKSPCRVVRRDKYRDSNYKYTEITEYRETHREYIHNYNNMIYNNTYILIYL